jgi:hypothetical protein
LQLGAHMLLAVISPLATLSRLGSENQQAFRKELQSPFKTSRAPQQK